MRWFAVSNVLSQKRTTVTDHVDKKRQYDRESSASRCDDHNIDKKNIDD